MVEILSDAVEKVKKTLEGLAEMMVKTMSDVLYLRKELQEQKEYTQHLNMKLGELSKMFLVLLNEQENPAVIQKITSLMLSNKEFVHFAEELTDNEDFDSVLEAMSNNPMFADKIDLENMTDDERESFKRSWEETKEMFTLAGMQHDLLEEE